MRIIFRNLILEKKWIRISLSNSIPIFYAFVFFLMPGVLFAQNINISGEIRSESGELLPGVNVIIKGTTRGTVTDIDGKYTYQVDIDDVLLFSFIGFETKEVTVNGRSKINVILSPSVNDLEEIVKIGYGQVKRANLLGSVSSMTSKEIEDIPVANMTSLLEGRLAGVSVAPAQPTGNPVASTRVRIRAETTFGTAGGGEKDPTPLYVIDDFESSQSDFDMLDPSEVESISVLKDASAAVYGSKGANGVILVKTKRGKEGKLKLSYSGSYGIMDATTQTEMLSAYEHALMLNEKERDNVKFTPITDEELEVMKGLDYNWLDDAWKTSSLTRHSVNISGGNEKVRYYGGGSYVYTEGNLSTLGIGKYSYRMSIDAEITEGLNASATISVDNKDYKRPYYSGAGANTMEDFFEVLLQAPRWQPYMIDDKYVINNVEFNPFALFNSNSFRQHKSIGNKLNLKLSYDFKKIKGLRAEFAYSRDVSNSYSKEYSVPYTVSEFGHPSPDSIYQYILSNQVQKSPTVENKNRIGESYSNGKSYQVRSTVSYANTFGKHDISSFILYEQRESEGLGFEVRSENVVIPDLALQEAFDNKNADADSDMSESGSLGGVGRISYSYDSKYLLEASGRYEGTTKFAPSQRTGFFPSIALGWVMSQENFMKNNLSFINFLKIRGSVGVTGYASVGEYEYLLKYGICDHNYLFGTGTTTASGLQVGGKTDVISTGVSWEKSKMQNYGIDLKFLDSKLGISIDGFYTHQTDILTNRASVFSRTAGIDVMPSENIGELKAWGYDASVSYNGTIGADFRWFIRGVFNYSTNRKIKGPTEWDENDFRYTLGQSTISSGREEGYIDKGIIRTQDQLDAINAEWNEKWGHDYLPFGEQAEVGMLYYQDIGRKGYTSEGEPPIVFEPDGIVSEESDFTYVQRVNDHFVLKNLLPSSMSLGGSYKSLSFNLLFTMQYGIENQVVDKLARQAPTEEANAPAFWQDYFSETSNPNGAYPNPKFDSMNKLVSTFWMRDVKSLRLTTVNISYNVPKNLSKKIGIPSLRFYFVGNNIWSPIQTFDYKEDKIARFNTYPLLRQFNFGVNVSF